MRISSYILIFIATVWCVCDWLLCRVRSRCFKQIYFVVVLVVVVGSFSLFSTYILAKHASWIVPHQRWFLFALHAIACSVLILLISSMQFAHHTNANFPKCLSFIFHCAHFSDWTNGQHECVIRKIKQDFLLDFTDFTAIWNWTGRW